MARKKSKNYSAMIVAIVAIILIIIVGITAKERENITTAEKWVGNLISPVQKVFNTGINRVGESISSLANITKLKSENTKLKEQIEELEKEVIDLRLTRDELEELKGLKYALNYVEDNEEYHRVVADIVGKSPGNWFNTFTIDKGEKQGIKKDSIVLDSKGLVGRVYEVGGNWAKVIAIIDNNSSVSFQILRDSNLQGIISGSINSELTGYLFDPQAEVIVGDKIVTSGLGIYPEGILIGEIVEIDKSGDHLLKTITVEPAVNFKRITRVLVMDPRKIEE